MNGGAARMVYDGDGNRVEKTVNGVTTRYLVGDLNPTGYAQVVEETVNGAPQRTYTYGLQRISENQIVNNTWTPSFYGYDGMGMIGLVIPDPVEMLVFGQTRADGGSWGGKCALSGEPVRAIE